MVPFSRCQTRDQEVESVLLSHLKAASWKDSSQKVNLKMDNHSLTSSKTPSVKKKKRRRKRERKRSRSSTVEARLLKRFKMSNPLLRMRLRSCHLAQFCTIWDTMDSLTSHSIWSIVGWRASRPAASVLVVLLLQIIKVLWIYNSVQTASMPRIREPQSRWRLVAVMALEEALSSSISKQQGSMVKKFLSFKTLLEIKRLFWSWTSPLNEVLPRGTTPS